MKKSKLEKEEKVCCIMCNRTKAAADNFYRTWNPLFKAKRIHICKGCISDYCTKKTGDINIVKFKYLLRLVDLPFIYSYYQAAIESKTDSIGKYFSLLSLPQNRGKSYLDSDLDITEDVFNIQQKHCLLEEELEEIKKKIDLLYKK